MPISLPNVEQFSKLFHSQTQQEICTCTTMASGVLAMAFVRRYYVEEVKWMSSFMA